MKIDDDLATLSSGRKFWADGGAIAVDDNGVLCGGADGPDLLYGDDPLTSAERIEISEFMIDRWRKWGCIE